MKEDDYISTGILEAYVLGEVTPLQRKEIEARLIESEALRKELSTIEQTFEALALASAIRPRPSLKVQVLEPASPQSKVVRLGAAWKWATAASVTLALLATYMAYTYHSRWRAADLVLNNYVAQNQQLASDYKVVNERLNKIESDMGVIENTAFQKVVMNGTANAPGSMASVYWNPQSRDVYLSIQNLKALTAAHQFQLWAIVDGKPIDAGVFDTGFSGLLKMKSIAGATAFAVTIEQKGGSPSPTLETMQVVGTLPKG